LDDDVKETPPESKSPPAGEPPSRDDTLEKEEPTTQVSLELTAFRSVLRQRDFMALWVGQGISGMGDWVIVGVLLDMVNRMGGTTGLFIMLTFRFLPAFLFGLLAGAVVDRLERKTLMIVCEVCRGALVLVLAFANSLAMICVLVFSIECFTLLFGPAKDSSIPDLVQKDEVLTANSMMSTSTYLTMALGTFLATLILGLGALVYKLPLVSNLTTLQNFQHTFAFILDALTFIISAMLIFTIAFPRRFEGKRPDIKANQIWADFKEGLVYMRSNPLTRSILGVMIIGFIGGGSLYILGAPFAQQVLGAVGSKFTLILTFLLFGVVVGAALAPWLSRYFPVSKWFGRAAVGFGLAMFIFAWIDFYPLSLAVIFLGGFLLGYLLVTAYTLLHKSLDEDIRGRVFAAFQTIMRTCLIISMGIFAGVSSLFALWIPWTAEKPVFKTLNLGFIHKSIYPAMLAVMVGAVIVMVGGVVAIRGLRPYFKSNEEQETEQDGTRLPEVEPGLVFIAPEEEQKEGSENGEGTPNSN
jgi:dTMP kinase